MRFRRWSNPETAEQFTERPVFTDPFPPGTVDTESLKKLLHCTMEAGVLKTAIEKVTEGAKPSIAREVLIETLSGKSYPEREGYDIYRFVDSLIAPEVIEAGRDDIDRYSDGPTGLANNLKFMPYKRGVHKNLLQISRDLEVREKVIKTSCGIINNFIYESYVSAMTPELQEQIVASFEHWHAAQA